MNTIINQQFHVDEKENSIHAANQRISTELNASAIARCTAKSALQPLALPMARTAPLVLKSTLVGRLNGTGTLWAGLCQKQHSTPHSTPHIRSHRSARLCLRTVGCGRIVRCGGLCRLDISFFSMFGQQPRGLRLCVKRHTNHTRRPGHQRPTWRAWLRRMVS